jgi:transcription-repair coupling factor (superfamily II helicase)
MDIYRRIAVAKNDEELKQTSEELVDMYGPLPDEVAILLEICQLRIAASKWQIKSISTSGANLIFKFEKDTTGLMDELFAKVKRPVRLIDSQTVYMTLPENYFEPKTLITVLRKIFLI